MHTLGLPLGIVLTAAVLAAAPADWPRFRGPNATGVADNARTPVSIGPNQNVKWKTALPPGVSSPVLTDKRIFLTASEDGQLLTLAVDRATG
ncbi:MAG: pyrrolo-quinoline quinone, partial [bacterium]|nr:pyrrolo-quinoline quinone [bacterium]